MRFFSLSSEKTFLREIVFGLEDGFVSTFGTIAGLAVTTQNTPFVLLSGLILIAVEATSMAAGAYLSSKAAGTKKEMTFHHAIVAGVVMWVCYAVGGLVPLIPYLFWKHPLTALIPSTLFTVTGLFFVGVMSGHLTHRSIWKNGFEMMIVSLCALGVGIGIGVIADRYLLPLLG